VVTLWMPCHEDDDPTPGSMVTRQINDIKAFVVALRADTAHCNGTIGVVGGSSGATLAAYVAIDTTDTHGAWPFWNADARPQCAVMLSAAYDFSDMTPPPGHAEIDFSFLLGTQNFVNSSDLAILKSHSPVALGYARQ
jgi:acetyl esterase/lipase